LKIPKTNQKGNYDIDNRHLTPPSFIENVMKISFWWKDIKLAGALNASKPIKKP
jgi:hypothetical protein